MKKALALIAALVLLLSLSLSAVAEGTGRVLDELGWLARNTVPDSRRSR